MRNWLVWRRLSYTFKTSSGLSPRTQKPAPTHCCTSWCDTTYPSPTWPLPRNTSLTVMSLDPKSGGGLDRASSSDALGSRFEPRSVYKRGFFTTPMPKGFRWARQTPNLMNSSKGAGLTKKLVLMSLGAKLRNFDFSNSLLFIYKHCLLSYDFYIFDDGFF